MFGDESILFEKTQVTFASTLRESTGTTYNLVRIGEAFIQGRQEGWFGFGVDAITSGKPEKYLFTLADL
jgi:hypothetical protein